MKKEDLTALGVPEEAAEKILELNTAEVEKAREGTEKLKEDLKAIQGQLSQRDQDLSQLKKSAGSAEQTQKQLEELQAKYDKESKEYQSQLAARDYSDALREHLEGVSFTSNSAKEAFLMKAKEKAMKLQEGKLEGFGQFLKEYQEKDAGAFVPEKKEDAPPELPPASPLPRFMGSAGGQPPQSNPFPMNFTGVRPRQEQK